jgi:hypothetical protein
MRVFAIILLGLSLWSCDGGSVLGPESMRVKFPIKGSTFYFESYEIDRYNDRVPGSTVEYSSVVVSTDTILFGKSDAYVLRNQYRDTSYLEFYHVDEDQNLQHRITLGNSTVWMKIPISTLAETKDTVSSYIDLGQGRRGILEYVYMHSYYGDESFTIDTVRVSGRKFRSRLKYQTTYSGRVENSGEIQSIDHYLPSLGVMAYSYSPAYYDEQNSRWINGYVIRLKKYEQ